MALVMQTEIRANCVVYRVFRSDEVVWAWRVAFGHDKAHRAGGIAFVEAAALQEHKLLWLAQQEQRQQLGVVRRNPVVDPDDISWWSESQLCRKADQAWEMAGCARVDGDTKDEAYHTANARRYLQELGRRFNDHKIRKDFHKMLTMGGGDELMDKYLQPHKPCNGCPFRASSVRGWFGPYNAEFYFQAAMGEGRVQCHSTSGKPAGRPAARHCTGVVLFRRKVCKEPRGREQQAHQDKCVERYSTNGILDAKGFRQWHYMDNPELNPWLEGDDGA